MTGKFITLEGGEGVGKSTLARGIAEWLRSINCKAIVTREPGGTPIGDELRRIFKNPPSAEEMTAETEALLVSAARSQHVSKVIRPALERGDWVICDRYSDSTRVYQGLLGGVALNDLEWLIKFSTFGTEPRLTFLLDCDVQVSTLRIGDADNTRDNASRYDHAHLSVHERLRKGFRQVAGFFPARFYILDASSNHDDVLETAKFEIKRRFADELMAKK